MGTTGSWLLIGIFVCLAVLGLVVSLRVGRGGDWVTGVGVLVLVGYPGFFLALLGSVDRTQWLYIPGVVLILSATFLQMIVWRRLRAKNAAAPDDANGAGAAGE